MPALAQRMESTNTHYRVWALDRVITDAKGRRMPAHAQGMLAGLCGYLHPLDQALRPFG